MNKIYPYAGFWKRALAFIIDSFALSIPTFIMMGILWVPQVMSFVKIASSDAEPSPEVIMGIMGRYFLSLALTWILCIGLGWLYSALMESSKYQGTLGKMALGIKVTGPNGERISFARATGRFFGKMISGMTLYFGFYMAGFTQKRQALHDMMANTFVIDKKQPEGAELPALPFSKGFCITSVIVALAPMAMYVMSIILVIIAGIAAGMNETQPNIQLSQPPAITQQLDS